MQVVAYEVIDNIAYLGYYKRIIVYNLTSFHI